MDNNFYSFYKRAVAKNNLPFNAQQPGKETKRSRQHHQSLARTIGKTRKSGNLNLVPRYHSKHKINPTIDNFINSNQSVMPNLNSKIVFPILQAYHLKHNGEEEAPYIKSIHGVQCKTTGKKIWIQYNPEKELWTLFKK